MKIALIGTTAESLIQFRKELINLLHKMAMLYMHLQLTMMM